ncbi:hypothetical protein U728_1057 [Clostridium botulinum 202F]|nr:hypothetical protein U728_1057 [Clostridium botulinum 202F]KAI3345960.1 hypothetical protein CIT17_10270 [Clostridium botulinum]MBY6987839.1 hypothetical protein [Clostridium botulinum]
MTKKVGKYEYEKAEATFNKENELDMELYSFLAKNSKVIGKSSYLKQLIYEKMLKSRE